LRKRSGPQMDTDKPSSAFDRNQNDPTDFTSVVRVILHYLEINQR
jgi:hypothetical protein